MRKVVVRWTLRGSAVLFLAFAAFASACSEGRTIHERAVALEAEGKRVEAAEQFSLVCERAPQSDLCPASRKRAAELRVDAAKALIAARNYEEANALLDRVQASSVPEAQKLAKELAGSVEMEKGLKWERASKLPDDSAKFAVMVEVYAAGVPVSDAAGQWLKTAGMPFRLEAAKKACAKPANSACLRTTLAIAADAPGTPEAATAQRLHDDYVKAEQDRIVQLLEQAELLLPACAMLWKQDKTFQAWAVKKLARARYVPHRGGGSHAPIVGVCKDDDIHDTCTKVADLEKRCNAIGTQVGYASITRKSRARMAEACYGGAYTKVQPQPPRERDMSRFTAIVD